MRIAVRVIVMLGCLIALAGAREAQALPQYHVEVLYYDWQNYNHVGEEVRSCGGTSWTYGDRTNYENGELKYEYRRDCFTWEETEQWWRWQALCGTDGYWVAISEPEWWRTWYC